MTSRLAGLTGATLETAPSVCQTCIWWQSRGNREPDKRKWIERAEGEWGAWGTVYRDDDGRVLGSMQYGPVALFPRAADLPAIEVTSRDVPSPTNPLGVKGAGEGGTVGAPGAVIHAILDALASLGVTHLDMPATPERVWRAIREAGAAR